MKKIRFNVINSGWILELTEMAGKVCIVTGSNSGIGKATAIGLAQKGATVIMACRNAQRGQSALDEITQVTGSKNVELMICDVASRESINHFVSEFTSKHEFLNVLINNAGAVFSKRQLSEDGFERTLAVNYLGPFLLTRALLSHLKSGSPSRVINLCSGLYKSGEVILDDLQSARNYSSQKVYRNAKLLLLMHTYALARKLEGSGVTFNAVLPGFVATNLGKNSGSRIQALMFGMMKPFQLSPKEGAQTSIYVASLPEITGLSGKCFSKKQAISTTETSTDEDLQEKLWAATLEMLGLPEY